MNKLILLILTGILISCTGSNQRETQETSNLDEKLNDKSALIINKELINEFYFNSVIYPDNPELDYQLVKVYSYDLNKDGEADSIKIFKIGQLENDPGDFHSIQFKMSNGESYDQINADGWIKENNYQPDLNLIDSEYLSVIQFEEKLLVMCYGWYYASDPPQLTIFDFSSDRPRVVFHKNFAINNLTIENSIVLTGQSVYSYDEAGQLNLNTDTLFISDGMLYLSE